MGGAGAGYFGRRDDAREGMIVITLVCESRYFYKRLAHNVPRASPPACRSTCGVLTFASGAIGTPHRHVITSNQPLIWERCKAITKAHGSLRAAARSRCRARSALAENTSPTPAAACQRHVPPGLRHEHVALHQDEKRGPRGAHEHVVGRRLEQLSAASFEMTSSPGLGARCTRSTRRATRRAWRATCPSRE